MMRTLACVVGTRPEAIKMAPVIRQLRRPGSGFQVRVVATGQHGTILDQALAHFGLVADIHLDLMRAGQSLADLTARGLTALADYLAASRPEGVLAQGDTTSVLCTAMACNYLRIPFAHVEAGLRTGDPDAPFPEETNRILTSRLARLHFAPTEQARRNLLAEGIRAGDIYMTGNPVVDALQWTAARDLTLPVTPPTDRFVLVTAHRRENFGAPLDRICQAVLALTRRNPSLSVVIPVHPNPVVRETVHARLDGRERVRLIDPVDYPQFVALLKGCFLVLTDSGGVQEEAPALGKPVLVLREGTERPEAVDCGASWVVGTDTRRIVSAVEVLLNDPGLYEGASRAVSPFGDGRAAHKIVRVLGERWGMADADAA